MYGAIFLYCRPTDISRNPGRYTGRSLPQYRLPYLRQHPTVEVGKQEVQKDDPEKLSEIKEKVIVEEVKAADIAVAPVIAATVAFPPCRMFLEGDVLKSNTLMVQI